MNKCSFPDILLLALASHGVRQPSHTCVMSARLPKTQSEGYFSLLEVSLEEEVSVLAVSGLPSEAFAIRRRRGHGTVSAGSARTGGLLGVIGNVPAGAFELDCGRREQLLQFASAMRADGQRRIGKLLDPLGQAVAFLALIFVKRQCDVPTRSKLLILFSAVGCGQSWRRMVLASSRNRLSLPF